MRISVNLDGDWAHMKSIKKPNGGQTKKSREPATTEPVQVFDEVDVSILAGRFGYNLRRTHAAVLRHLEGAFEPLQIRPRQFGILAIVGRNPGLNQGQVSEALGIARTNFVAMLDTLEKRGFVRREASANDRRSYALFLTAKGSAMLSKLHQIDNQHEAKMRSLIGEEDSSQLLILLSKLRRAAAISAGD